MKKQTDKGTAQLQLLQELVMATNELVTVLMYVHDLDPVAYYKWKDEQKAKFIDEVEQQKAQFTKPEELAELIENALNKTKQ